jgi:serine/threonine-protein kinase
MEEVLIRDSNGGQLASAVSERFIVVRELGQGAFAKVFLAHDTVSGELIALKELNFELRANQVALERFRREATALASVSNRHVVAIKALINQPNKLALALEYVDGKNLREYLAGGALQISEALRIIYEIALGLKAIHSQGIIHRDLKPENILVNYQGTAKIADFGVAALAQQATLTQFGKLIGSVRYIAPEFIDTGESDGRADVYAWGVIAFELIAGRSPYLAKDLKQLLNERLEVDLYPLLERLRPEAGEKLLSLITKAMSISVIDRVQNADELIKELLEIDPNLKNRAPGRYSSSGKRAQIPDSGGWTKPRTVDSAVGRESAILSVVDGGGGVQASAFRRYSSGVSSYRRSSSLELIGLGFIAALLLLAAAPFIRALLASLY